jgi:hypothetical protein
MLVQGSRRAGDPLHTQYQYSRKKERDRTWDCDYNDSHSNDQNIHEVLAFDRWCIILIDPGQLRDETEEEDEE